MLSTETERKPCDLEQFENIFDATLSKHAPYKSVLIRGNKKPHTTKPLRKEIMKRTRLRIKLIEQKVKKIYKNIESKEIWLSS